MPLSGALNLTPVLAVVAYIIAAGVGIALFFFIGSILLEVVTAPFRFFTDQRTEFDEVVVFYGGIALVIALIVAAFHFHLVALE